MTDDVDYVEDPEACPCKLCTNAIGLKPELDWCYRRGESHEDLAYENPRIATFLAQCEALDWCHKWMADLEGGDLCMDFEAYPPFMTFISIMNDMLRGRAEGLAMSIDLTLNGHPRWLYGYGFGEEE